MIRLCKAWKSGAEVGGGRVRIGKANGGGREERVGVEKEGKIKKILRQEMG